MKEKVHLKSSKIKKLFYLALIVLVTFWGVMILLPLKSSHLQINVEGNEDSPGEIYKFNTNNAVVKIFLPKEWQAINKSKMNGIFTKDKGSVVLDIMITEQIHRYGFFKPITRFIYPTRSYTDLFQDKSEIGFKELNVNESNLEITTERDIILDQSALIITIEEETTVRKIVQFNHNAKIFILALTVKEKGDIDNEWLDLLDMLKNSNIK